MTDPLTAKCADHHSGPDGCGAPVRYTVGRPAKFTYACGRHLARLVDYMTVPGRTVKVTKL